MSDTFMTVIINGAAACICASIGAIIGFTIAALLQKDERKYDDD